MARTTSPTAPTIGTPSPSTSRATVSVAMAPPINPKARTFPVSTSAALTGAMRNSSITPLVRSRTRDIATSVTARCWRIRASTAGAK